MPARADRVPLPHRAVRPPTRRLAALAAGALLAGGGACADLTQPNPNQRSQETFWRTQDDALNGINATYNGLTLDGTYGRNLVLLTDGRSDIARGLGANAELNALIRFSFVNYNAGGFNAGVWQDHYNTIYRANQVIAEVPDIAMDAALAGRVVAEAKFLRALMYFNLVTLYGNVPLVLEPLEAQATPPQVPPADVWAQIEKDLTEARAALPRRAQYAAADLGRATSGAATALLGKAQLQQRRWADAAATFKSLVDGGEYTLLANYADLFDATDENHAESVFEVQFADLSVASTGARGNDVPRLYGVQGVSFIQLQPTVWYQRQFFNDTTRTTGAYDPRLDATMFWDRPGGMDVYGRTFRSRFPNPGPNNLYWKKWAEHQRTAQDFDAPVNFTVIRYADVLLMYAEALVEQGQVTPALALVNQVRARARVAPATAADQATARRVVEREMLLELGWEHGRWWYLQRHDLLPKNAAGIAAFTAKDVEFSTFVVGRSELMPIPLVETNYNANVKQNPGY
jgi:hypothetical protein